MIGLRYSTDINIVGDAKQTLRHLLPLLKRKDNHQWRTNIEELVRQSWQELERRAMQARVVDYIIRYLQAMLYVDRNST